MPDQLSIAETQRDAALDVCRDILKACGGRFFIKDWPELLRAPRNEALDKALALFPEDEFSDD